jgi:hypothetical protein
MPFQARNPLIFGKRRKINCFKRVDKFQKFDFFVQKWNKVGESG